MRALAIGIFLAIPVLATPALAAVTATDVNGFEVTERASIAVPPRTAWALLVTPSRWWNSEHTWSGKAANLRLDPRAGGCWCETLPHGGSVQHMTVDFVQPEQRLRMRGALGPLGSLAVTGVMGVSLKPDGTGTAVTVSYTVGGYAPGGFAAIAPAVDSVLGEQVTRLKAAAEKP